jgi:hypothetical protein
MRIPFLPRAGTRAWESYDAKREADEPHGAYRPFVFL